MSGKPVEEFEGRMAKSHLGFKTILLAAVVALPEVGPLMRMLMPASRWALWTRAQHWRWLGVDRARIYLTVGFANRLDMGDTKEANDSEALGSNN